MKFRAIKTHFFLIGALLFCFSNLEAQSFSLGRKLYEKVQSQVLVVKTATSEDSPRRSYGSGWVYSVDGLLVTNFHVVSEAFSTSDIYKIFVGQDDQWQTAKIVNVDVTHDLALLKVPNKFKSSLKISNKNMAVGDRVYSLGLPQDLNMSIIEGVFNGFISNGPYEQIYLSTALNSGMSGGPTIDREGNVIGVNVAYLNESQNLSFAVPAKYIADLVKPLKTDDLKKVVKGQLLDVQNRLTMNELRKTKSVSLPGWEIMKPSDGLKCYSDRRLENEKYFEESFRYCYLPLSSYLTDDVSTGTYEVHFRIIQNKTLNNLQIFSLMEGIYNDGFSFWHDRATYSEEWPTVTKNDCGEYLMTNKNDIPLKINFCNNAYVDYPGLYQSDVKLVTLLNHSSTLFVFIRFLGFEKENIKDVLKAYLQSIRKI